MSLQADPIKPKMMDVMTLGSAKRHSSRVFQGKTYQLTKQSLAHEFGSKNSGFSTDLDGRGDSGVDTY